MNEFLIRHPRSAACGAPYCSFCKGLLQPWTSTQGIAMKPPVSCTCMCDPNCPNKHKIVPPETREVSYIEKIIRYIPGPLVTSYMFLDGVLKEQTLNCQLPLYWLVFLTILILTPLYVLYRPTFIVFWNEPPSRSFHAIIATMSFVVFAFTLGGPFEVTFPELYRPFFGTVLLVLTTLSIPVMERVALQSRFFKPPVCSSC